MSETLTFADTLISIHQTAWLGLDSARIRKDGKWSATGIIQLSDRSAGESVNAYSFVIGRAYRSEKAAREAVAKRFSVIEWGDMNEHGTLHGRVWAKDNPEAVAYAEKVLSDRAARKAARTM